MWQNGKFFRGHSCGYVDMYYVAMYYVCMYLYSYNTYALLIFVGNDSSSFPSRCPELRLLFSSKIITISRRKVSSLGDCSWIN